METTAAKLTDRGFKATLTCPNCEAVAEFESERYYDDQWTYKHGINEKLIKQLRREAAERRFWEQYRYWKDLKKSDPSTYEFKKGMRDMTRRMHP